MRKAELVRYIHDKTGMTLGDSRNALNALILGIIDGVKKDGFCSIRFFGRFELTQHFAKTIVINFKGKPKDRYKIGPRKVVKFRATDFLKFVLKGEPTSVKIYEDKLTADTGEGEEKEGE